MKNKRIGALRTLLSYFLVGTVTAAVLLGAFYFWKSQDDTVRFDNLKQTAEQVLTYQGEYEQYTPSHYEQYLDDKDRLLYQALKYAYDHGTQTVRLAEEYDQDTVTNINAVLKADYPQYTTSMLSMEMALRPGETKLTVNAREFDAVRKNEETTPYAQSVVEEMPQSLDEFDRAKYLYRYLVQNVGYTAEEGEDYALMSGVFVKGQANCDGFASALQLLYQMAGIECYKVYYHGSDIGSDVGHVWNIAVIDGAAYHVDASRGALVTREMKDTFASARAKAGDVVSYSGFLMTEEQALGQAASTINPFIRDKIDRCVTAKPADRIYDAVETEGGGEEFVDAAAQALKGKREQGSVFLSFHFQSRERMLEAQREFISGRGDAYAKQIGERAGFYGRVVSLSDTADDSVICALFEWGE